MFRLRLGNHGELDVLNLNAADGHAAIGPGNEGFLALSGGIVIVTGVAGLDATVVLGGLRNQLVADLDVGGPGRAVVGRLDAVAIVAASRIGSRGTSRGGLATVIPRNRNLSFEAGADSVVVDRQRGHPLGLVLTAGIVVQLDRSGPGRAVIGGANIVDVAVIVGSLSLTGIHVVNNVARTDTRLAPAHVAPDGCNISEVGVGRAGSVPRGIEARTHRGRSPCHAAIDGAEHDVLTAAESTAALIHASHENRAGITSARRRCANRRARDLNVADKGIRVADGHRGPGGAVVGVHQLQRTNADLVVAEGDVHAAILLAVRVVIDPQGLTVVSSAVVRAGTCGPVDAVGRGPQTDTLTAATGGKVAGKPLVELRIEDDDRIAVVGSVSISKRGRKDLGEGGATVGGVGSARIVVTVVIVVVDNDYVFGRAGALVHHAFALGAAAAGGAGAIADQNVRGLGSVISQRVTFHVHIGTRNDTAFHQCQAGAHVFLLQQVQGRNL